MHSTSWETLARVGKWLRRRLTIAGWWLRRRLTGGRCLACKGLLVAHTPWRSWRCNRTPLPLRITEQGQAWLQEHRHADAETDAETDLAAVVRRNVKRTA